MGGYAEVLLNNPTVNAVEYGSDRRPNIRFRFERGFLAYLDVCHLYIPVARMIRDAEETRFLRELVIGDAASGDSHEYDFEETTGDEEESPYAFEWGPDLPKKSNNNAFIGVYPLDGIKRFPAMRRLQIGEISNMDAAASDSWGGPDCHTYFETAAALAEKMPRLQELQLLCKDFDIDRLFGSKKLKDLKVLQVYHMGVPRGRTINKRERYEYPLDTLAKNKAFANLEQLLLHPHMPEWHDNIDEDHASFLPIEMVRALVNTKVLKKLTHLQLRMSDMGDAGCQVIVDSGILTRLKHLDLRHGCITDAGAETLANCPDLRHLDSLDLARNGLTKKGISRLKKTGVRVNASAQLSASQLDEREFMFDGDGE